MNTNEQLAVLHDFMIPGASHIEFQVKSLDAVLHSTWLVQEFTGGMLVLILSSASQNAIIFIYIYLSTMMINTCNSKGSLSKKNVLVSYGR